MVCWSFSVQKSDIKLPINLLEKKEDKKNIWRKIINQELKKKLQKNI